MNPAANLQQLNARLSRGWMLLGPRFLPFADAATDELPLSRLLRLSLFQVSVGMASVLLLGTLNRVMIVELGMSAWLVALMVALPVLLAPLRALVGFRSDFHVSALGWRRVPYLWFGSLMQFGGLAIMPFALVVLGGALSGEIEAGKAWIGHCAAALAFLLVGAGLQTTQTAGLALATDLAPEPARPRVVALMYVMLLLGMVGSSLLFGLLLRDFSATRLVQVVQGAAVVTMVINSIALWKQEPRRHLPPEARSNRPGFGQQWRSFAALPGTRRFLVTVALGSAAFSMQDIILEPYGGEILKLGVGATTVLTALMAGGALCAFALSARWLQRGHDPYRIAAAGLLFGLVAFSAVIFAEPLQSATLFRIGVALIGFGSGLFSVSTLVAAMSLDASGRTGAGLVLGAWGAVQAFSSGTAIATGGALRDLVSGLAIEGRLGSALAQPATGYSFVYHLELYLLFATLIAVGPLVRSARRLPASAPGKFGLADFPG
ncbi:BCD family MFS transporter [Rivibacter subsaxonicus]|uniref:BCD family chlorophyll transporter-like MFS transporter n=1 Tax=Rivibacter subsaxonicus TaxID=457575 RepID=A0A4Q7W0Z8_9BURK|nr:BCD family MFS transporter [Rivibacter subsaxonicus]RZU02871.1 BCD family chlorophyll transporter-like MFS transporter [Rivibacter subsaxonicus]